MTAERASVDFGRKLREARERRGVSLRQIAGATKISVAVLEALERDDISRLPGGIFSRAFVRSYAIEVGLDPEATIQDFVAQFPNDSVTAGHLTPDQPEDHDAVESDRQMATTFLRLIMVSVPIAIAVIYFSTSGTRLWHRAPPPVTAAAPVAHAAEPAPTPTQTPTSAPLEPVAAPPTPAAAPAAAPAPTGDRLTIGLTVRRPCWVSATVDGQKTIERLLQAGEAQTIEVKREIVLTAGDASAIAMTLNGADATPLGKAGEVVTRRVNLTNFRDFLQTTR